MVSYDLAGFDYQWLSIVTSGDPCFIQGNWHEALPKKEGCSPTKVNCEVSTHGSQVDYRCTPLKTNPGAQDMGLEDDSSRGNVEVAFFRLNLGDGGL